MSPFKKAAIFQIVCWSLVTGGWIANGVATVEAIKKQPKVCSEELEETRTQLRLRTAELRVAHSQLDAARKKLKKCGVKFEETDE
jgi:hypothetical protein